jgi:biopolymer transport protein ExbB/TolQ
MAKMLSALLFMKSLFSGAISFVMKHWRIVLPLLAILYCVYEYSSQVRRANNAERDLAAYIEDVENKAREIQFQNNVKLAVAKKTMEINEVRAKKQMEAEKLERQREAAKLKELYEKRDSNTKFNFSERLRMQAEVHSNGVAKITSNTSGFTEGERNSNAAFITLENACKVTTIDYNRLRTWADAACEQVGCN